MMETLERDITMNDIVAKRQYFQNKYMFDLKKAFPEDLHLPDKGKTYKVYSPEQTEKFISDVYDNLTYIDEGFKKYNISTIDDYINLLLEVEKYRSEIYFGEDCYSPELNKKNKFLNNTINLLYRGANNNQKYKIIDLLTLKMRSERDCRDIINKINSGEKNLFDLIFFKN